LDVSNASYGLTWSSREVPVVSIGDINTGKWQTSLSLNSTTFFAYLMNNTWDVNFKERQGGDFTFRFALTSHGPDWDHARAAQFGRGFCTELQPTLLPAGQVGPLPGDLYSFGEIDKPNVMILACKQAEDGDGYILRLLELAGEQTIIRLRWPGISATGAYRTNIVEQDLEPLGISGHEARVTIPPFGIETLRFRMRA
jgi:alpha-mannosidase